MPTKKPILSVVLDDELLDIIETYRYEKRLRSRSQAAVDLIKLGIQKDKEEGGE